MAAIPGWLLVHTVTVEPYVGVSARGPQYGPGVTVRCFIDDKRKLVRDPHGREVIAETTLYMRLDQVCPPESRVTVNGRPTTVLTSARRDGGGLATPDHLEVTLK